MKKLYTILSIVFILSLATGFAQPVVNGPNFPAVGTVITNFDVTATSVSPGNVGANQTWNFSAYPATGTSNSAQYVNPATTPFASTFPTATNATVSGTTMGNQGFGYMYATTSYVDLIGVAIESGGGPDIVYSYSNPERIGNYPTMYNNTFTDNFTGFATYVNGGSTINQYRYGTVTYKYDGYGTLTTLAGTFLNVVRSKLTQVITDSIVIVGFPVSTVSIDRNTTYSWGLATGYSALFSITYDTTAANGGPASYNKTAFYSTSVTGVEELNTSYKPLELYPNPVGSNSVINLRADDLKTGMAKFIAVDMQGRVVKSFDFTIYAGNHKSVSVDAADFAPGVYSVRIEQPDGIFVSRFTRQ